MPDMEFVTSITVEAIGYDAHGREVYVRFLKSGVTYIYTNVDQHVFDDFRISESKGKYVNNVLRKNYEYRKM